MYFADPGFACYAMHKDAIEAFIRKLAFAADPNDTDTQRRIARDVGLDWQALTSDEIEYIEREVSKYWRN
jgi:hypothetical protein